jgi:tRNA/rRNA methyltransferase
VKAELLNFFEHLEKELDACGFLRNAEKRPSMVRNIRNLFQRAALTHQEIRTLHGIVAELATYRQRRKKG